MTTVERERRLTDVVTFIADVQASVMADLAESTAGHVDSLTAERFKQTRERLFEIDSRYRPEDLDAASVAEIRGIIIDGLRDVDLESHPDDLDVYDDLLTRMEAIRHIIRDAIDEHVQVEDGDAKRYVLNLYEWLPGVPRSEISKLVGRSPRQMQRWARDGGEPTARLAVVTKLVAILRQCWTTEGVIAWFYRRRNELERKNPYEVLDDMELHDTLFELARRGRALHGS